MRHNEKESHTKKRRRRRRRRRMRTGGKGPSSSMTRCCSLLPLSPQYNNTIKKKKNCSHFSAPLGPIYERTYVNKISKGAQLRWWWWSLLLFNWLVWANTRQKKKDSLLLLLSSMKVFGHPKAKGQGPATSNVYSSLKKEENKPRAVNLTPCTHTHTHTNCKKEKKKKKKKKKKVK